MTSPVRYLDPVSGILREPSFPPVIPTKDYAEPQLRRSFFRHWFPFRPLDRLRQRQQHARRSIAELELPDKLGETGCPVCARVERESESYFFWLLYESYQDPNVLEAFRASFGFCATHGRYMEQQVQAQSQLTFMHAHIASHARRLIGQAGEANARDSALISPALCPACESFAGTAWRSAWFLASLLHDSDAAERYGKPGILCMPHLCLAATFMTPAIFQRDLDLHMAALSAVTEVYSALADRDESAIADTSAECVKAIDSPMELLLGRDVWGLDHAAGRA